MEQERSSRSGWTFLTNHARVLAYVARDPGARVRDIAAVCLLTERAVMRIISDLEDGGYLTHTRRGRTNHYRVIHGNRLRHPADRATVDELLALLGARPSADAGNPQDSGEPESTQRPPLTAAPAGSLSA